VPMLFAAARSSSILLFAVNVSYAFLRVLMYTPGCGSFRRCIAAQSRSHSRKLTLAAGDVKCSLIGGNTIGSSDRKLLPVCAFRDRGCQAPTI